jgi:hypothetical protein
MVACSLEEGRNCEADTCTDRFHACVVELPVAARDEILGYLQDASGPQRNR